MHSTVNETTVKIGQAQATVICDSEWNGKRITTLELLYPRYIHSELMTHRQFSRNASSSRATPISVTVADVRDNPVFFDFVGKNKSGMVAGESISEEELKEFKKDWCALANEICDWVEEMSERYKIHKQTLNRVLEPFLNIRTLVTATEWDNFFKLRLAADAQPEMQSLAKAMKEAMNKSKPAARSLHTPYVTDGNTNSSVARCARVSYGRLDAKESSLEDDLALYTKLLKSGHMSPFEHVAFAKDGTYANFVGWQSLRNTQEKVKL